MTESEDVVKKLQSLSVKLEPDTWFVTMEGNVRKFTSHLCAKDCIRVHPEIITEYVSGRGTPSMFTGKNWIKDGEGLLMSEIEAEGVISTAQIRASIESLCNLTRVRDPAMIGLPLDQLKSLPEHTIPIEAGLLNLLTKQLTPHTPDYFYTEYLPRNYIPGATPTVFPQLIDMMFKDDPNGDLKKAQLYDTFAWILMKNYKIQGAVVLFGQGGEGKSLIHALIENIFVRVSQVSLAELEDDKYKRSLLYGSWANLISESSVAFTGSEWFKRLTDGTKVTVEDKNKSPFTMASHAKMIIDTNELPNMQDEYRAFYRRVIAVIDFTKMLETIMTPTEINDMSSKLLEPSELDALFSYVIDNHYAPLVQRMKFTGQMNINEAKTIWEERSNPALAYLRLRHEAGDILKDVEDAKMILQDAGKDPQRYIVVSKNGQEVLVTPKQEVIVDAANWATKKGFPAKAIHAASLGKALNTLGYQNFAVNKKVGNAESVKAWNDMLIVTWTPVTDAVTGSSKPPVTGVEAVNSEEKPLSDGHFSYGRDIEGNSKYIDRRETSVTHGDSNQCSTEEKAVTGENQQSVTEPSPERPNNPIEPEAEPITDGVSMESTSGETGSVVFPSVDMAADLIQSHGLEIMEALWVSGEDHVRKFRIKGRMHALPKDVQEFLKTNFLVKFEGSFASEWIWIWAKIKEVCENE